MECLAANVRRSELRAGATCAYAAWRTARADDMRAAVKGHPGVVDQIVMAHPLSATVSCVVRAAAVAGVDLRTYRVIYDLVDDMRASMEGRLGIVDERTPVGGADVRAVFGSGSKRVAGVMVTDGAVRKGCLGQVRLYRLRGKLQRQGLCLPLAACARPAWPVAPLTLTMGFISASWSLMAPCASSAKVRCGAFIMMGRVWQQVVGSPISPCA